jgi:Holliday junction resolvase
MYGTTTEASKRGRASRNKGARRERELRDKLRELGFEDVTRGFVWNRTSDLVGLEGIHVECKGQEKLNIRAALSQAEEEAKKRNDGMPTVFSKTSRKPWIVTMYLEDWAKLYEAYLNGRTEE